MLIFAKPNPDREVNGLKLVVRDPQTRQFVPPEGQYIEDTDLYWHARLRDLDMVPAEPPLDE